MNTTGVQNYLSNVFRPIYTYDTTTSNFTPRLEMSNIDTYSGNTISVFTAAIGDANNNVYVGSNAGNAYNFTRNCRNVTALGYGAGSNISNDLNSIYIGWYAGSSGSNTMDVISIGTNSGGNGSSNIFLGTGTGTVGQSNVLIGHYIAPSNVSNQIRIGYRNQIPIAADLCTNWVGLGGYTAPVHTNDKLDVSGDLFVLGNIGINTEPGVEATLDVNGDFQSDDGQALLRFRTTNSNSLLSLSNYTGGTSSLSVGGFTKSTTGFSSIQGSVSILNNSYSTIGTIVPGIINVSTAQDASTGNPTAHHASSILFAYTPTGVTKMFDISLGNIFITTSNSELRISNVSASTNIYNYSITYFPLF